MSKLKIIPRAGRIVVKWDTPAGSTGRIQIPDKYKRRPQTGTVIAVGRPPDGEEPLEVGDRILFAQFSGTECGFSEPDNPTVVESYLVLSYSEVLSTIVGKAELVEMSA